MESSSNGEERPQKGGLTDELRARLRAAGGKRVHHQPPISRPPELMEYGKRVVENKVTLSKRRRKAQGENGACFFSAHVP